MIFKVGELPCVLHFMRFLRMKKFFGCNNLTNDGYSKVTKTLLAFTGLLMVGKGKTQFTLLLLVILLCLQELFGIPQV